MLVIIELQIITILQGKINHILAKLPRYENVCILKNYIRITIVGIILLNCKCMMLGLPLKSSPL